MVEKSVFYYKTMNFNEIEQISNTDYLNDFEDSENKTNCNLWLEEGFKLFSDIDIDAEKIDKIKDLLEEFDMYEKVLYEDIVTKCQNESDNKIQKEKQRFLIRLIDYCFREYFDNINSKMKNTIMEKLNEINNSYNDIENLNEEDLSDEEYMKKIEKVFETRSVPYFLLRRGFKLRKNLKDKLLEIKKLIKDSENEFKTTKSNSIIENLTFFKEKNNEAFFFLFINFLKQKKETKMIRDNIKLLCECFYINNSYYIKNIDELLNENEDYEIIFVSIEDIIKSKEKINEMLNSYYDLIINIELFQNPNEVYLDFLLFIKEITSKNYDILIKLLSEKINNYFDDNDIDNNDNYNKTDFDDNDDVKFKIKSYDFESIKNKFDNLNDDNLKKDFKEIVNEEIAFEKGCNNELYEIILKINKFFNFKDNSKYKTIEDRLKLIVNKKKKIKNYSIVTISISGLYSSFSDNEEDWKYLINGIEKIYKNNITYYYNWPSSYINLLDLIINISDFNQTKKKAKYCGQILGLIIASNIFFPNCKINLIAFSLGNHVLKYCLKQLEKYDKLHLINDIIFIAGATTLSKKWENRFNKVNGKIFNCYSSHDLALLYSYTITGKNPIGINELKFKNIKENKFRNIYFNSFHLAYRTRFKTLIEIISIFYD